MNGKFYKSKWRKKIIIKFFGKCSVSHRGLLEFFQPAIWPPLILAHVIISIRKPS